MSMLHNVVDQIVELLTEPGIKVFRTTGDKNVVGLVKTEILDAENLRHMILQRLEAKDGRSEEEAIR